MQLAIANSTAYCPPEILVRWLSGRKQRFAKAPYLKRVPRVRIPPSPPSLHMRQTPRDVSSHVPAYRRFEPWFDALPSKPFGVKANLIAGFTIAGLAQGA